MKIIKTALVIIGIVAAAIVAFAAIAMVVTALQYVFWLAIIGLAGAAAYKFFVKSNAPQQLENKYPVNELESADLTLEKYKQKYLSK